MRLYVSTFFIQNRVALDRGIFHQGIARARRGDCGPEKLLAFLCGSVPELYVFYPFNIMAMRFKTDGGKLISNKPFFVCNRKARLFGIQSLFKNPN